MLGLQPVLVCSYVSDLLLCDALYLNSLHINSWYLKISNHYYRLYVILSVLITAFMSQTRMGCLHEVFYNYLCLTFLVTFPALPVGLVEAKHSLLKSLTHISCLT